MLRWNVPKWDDADDDGPNRTQLLVKAKQGFEYALGSLYELHTTLAPQVEVLDDRNQVDEALARELKDRATRYLTAQQRTEFDEYLNLLFGERDESEVRTPGEMVDRLLSIDEVAKAAAWEAVKALARVASQPKKQSIVKASIVVIAVGAFEALIRELIYLAYETFPGILDTKAKEFSIADLERYYELADVIDDAVASRAENVVRGGLDSWSEWMADSPLGIRMRELALDWDDTVELFQRRHLILHHAGRVSRRYLKKVSAHDPGLLVGTELTVDSPYVVNALDLLLVLGHRMASIADDKICGGTLDPREVEDLLRAGRWAAAEALAETGERTSSSTEKRLRYRCERWCARAQLHGWDPIQEDVSAWDASALSPLFKLARFTLLRDLDGAFALLPGALESGAVSRRDLFEWPVLENLYSDPRLDAFRGVEEEAGF